MPAFSAFTSANKTRPPLPPPPPIAQPHLVLPDNAEERKRKKKKIRKPYWKKIDHIKRGSRNFICLFICMFIPAYNLLATFNANPLSCEKSCEGVIVFF